MSQAADPLFVHQYSHAWFDFRKKHDKFVNYFENSIIATRAHKAFCISLRSPILSGLLGHYGFGQRSMDTPRGAGRRRTAASTARSCPALREALLLLFRATACACCAR